MFQRIEGLPVSSTSSVQGTSSSSSVGFSTPTSLNDENATRPLPYDAENRFTRLQRGLVSRREKTMTHYQEDSQSGMEIMDFAKRRLGGADSADQDASKSGNLESLEKSLKVKASEGLLYEQTSDSEDVCPTCLEGKFLCVTFFCTTYFLVYTSINKVMECAEYNLENPKIVTQCSHHFHLGCIYEWMERSDTCPMCGKVRPIY